VQGKYDVPIQSYILYYDTQYSFLDEELHKQLWTKKGYELTIHQNIYVTEAIIKFST
jgi:hypothetical protein